MSIKNDKRRACSVICHVSNRPISLDGHPQGEVFSMQEMQQLKESFKVADKDRVGFLDSKQFKRCLIGLGLTATEHELDQLLVDLGCDPVNFPFAKITFDKFAQYLCLMRAE